MYVNVGQNERTAIARNITETAAMIMNWSSIESWNQRLKIGLWVIVVNWSLVRGSTV